MSQPSVILATAGYDHTIRFWEAKSGRCYRTIQYPDSVSSFYVKYLLASFFFFQFSFVLQFFYQLYCDSVGDDVNIKQMSFV